MTEIFENGYAIVIGVDDNQIERLALQTVAKDVQALYDVLVHPERCAFNPENVKLFKGSDSSRHNILEALYWLQEKVKADPEATAVIYYSGHGMVDEATDQYYLIPYDIRGLNRIRADALKAETLTAEIAAIQAKRMLVVLDCCHAGGMEVKNIDLAPTNTEPNVKSASFPIDLSEIALISTESASKAVSDLLDGEGRAILNSSTSNQQSYVRRDGQMSLFTYHLIEALTGHAPHPDDSKVVYVTDVMSWVTHEVKKSARAEGVEQTPVMRTSGVFPVAQLLGGKGVSLSKGESAPRPDHLLPDIKPNQPQPGGPTITINQQGQKVGDQIIVGHVQGDIDHLGNKYTT